MKRLARPPRIRGCRMVSVLHVRHEGLMVTIIVRDAVRSGKPSFDGCRVVRPIIILVDLLCDSPDHWISPEAGHPVPAKPRHKGFRKNCKPGRVSDPGNLSVGVDQTVICDVPELAIEICKACEISTVEAVLEVCVGFFIRSLFVRHPD